MRILLLLALLSVTSCGVWVKEWNAEMRLVELKGEGEAQLAQQESEKKIMIEDAKAKLESAKLLAAAEIERAKGVAEANRIIGQSLKENEGYLRYLWIQNMNNEKEVIYIPTEAGMPILEAKRK